MSGKSNFNYPPDQWNVDEGEWGVDFYEINITPVTIQPSIVVEKEAGVIAKNVLLQTEEISLRPGLYVARGIVQFPPGWTSGKLFVSVLAGEDPLGYYKYFDPDDPEITLGQWSDIEIFFFANIFEPPRLRFGLFGELPDQADEFKVYVDSLIVEKDPLLFTAIMSEDQTIDSPFADRVAFDTTTSRRVSTGGVEGNNSYSLVETGVYRFHSTITLGNITTSQPFTVRLRIQWRIGTSTIVDFAEAFTPEQPATTEEVFLSLDYTAYMLKDPPGAFHYVSSEIEIVTTDSAATFDILADQSRFSGFRVNE